MNISLQYIDAITQHANREYPNECCGILAGKDGSVFHIYKITSVDRSPHRYNMKPEELLNAFHDSECKGWEFVAFYHSHIHADAYPSATDIQIAKNWPGVLHIIVATRPIPPSVRAFHIVDGNATEVSLV